MALQKTEAEVGVHATVVSNLRSACRDFDADPSPAHREAVRSALDAYDRYNLRWTEVSNRAVAQAILIRRALECTATRPDLFPNDGGGMMSATDRCKLERASPSRSQLPRAGR